MLIQAYYDNHMVAEKQIPDTLMETDKINASLPAILKEFYYNKRREMIQQQQQKIYSVISETFGIEFEKLEWVVTIRSNLNRIMEM